MLQRFTRRLAVTCLVALACEAEVDPEATDRAHEGLCVSPSERGTLVLELSDDLVAETVDAPPGEAPVVFLEFEGEQVALLDDGRGLDLVANDGVFTGEVEGNEAHFGPSCLSLEHDEPDESDAPLAPSPHRADEVQEAFEVDSRPQARINGCHEENVAYTSCGEVWYCTCWAWDIWSC
jgi:hypothetical protein